MRVRTSRTRPRTSVARLARPLARHIPVVPGGDGWAARSRSLVPIKQLLTALAIYLVLALLGLYADWRALAVFDLDYFAHAGLGDVALAPVRAFALALDLGFVLLLGAFSAVLLLVAAGCRRALRALRAIRERWSSPGTAATAYATLPFVEPFRPEEPFRSDLRAVLTRPLWLLPVLGLGAVLAIPIHADWVGQDLRSFAKAVQHAHYRLGPAEARYQLVAVQTLAAPTPKTHLVRLGATLGFDFYYDLLHGQTLALPADGIVSEVAEAEMPIPERAGRPIGPVPAGGPALDGAAAAGTTAPPAPSAAGPTSTAGPR